MPSLDIRDESGASVSVRDVLRATGTMVSYESGGKLECSLAVQSLHRL